MLVEGRQYRLGVEAVLNFDDHAQAILTVGQIQDIRDALQFLLIDPVLNLFDDLFGAHQVGQLSHHDALLAGGHLLNGDLGPHLEDTPALLVGFLDAGGSQDATARG